MRVSLIVSYGRKWGLESLVVMYSLKCSSYGISLSPNLICFNPSASNTSFETIESRDGSILSEMSYSSKDLPVRMAVSKYLRHFSPSLSFVIIRSFSGFAFGPYIFLIHVFAWVCGSISKGQFVVLVQKIPFSIETLSLGNP